MQLDNVHEKNSIWQITCIPVSCACHKCARWMRRQGQHSTAERGSSRFFGIWHARLPARSGGSVDGRVAWCAGNGWALETMQPMSIGSPRNRWLHGIVGGWVGPRRCFMFSFVDEQSSQPVYLAVVDLFWEKNTAGGLFFLREKYCWLISQTNRASNGYELLLFLLFIPPGPLHIVTFTCNLYIYRCTMWQEQV
jgi:hypothetical protein